MRALGGKEVKLHLRQSERGKSINNSKTFKFGFINVFKFYVLCFKQNKQKKNRKTSAKEKYKPSLCGFYVFRLMLSSRRFKPRKR